ncbi:MAG TPA: hypothetical protein VF939_13665 [Puia sp.]
MKKILALCIVSTCMIVVFLFTGCQKDAKDPLDKDELVPCQVQKIVIPGSLLVASNRIQQRPYIAQNIPYKVQHLSGGIAPGASDTLIFTYNKSGNPVSGIHQMNIGENLLFRYDKWNRLTEYINIYPDELGDYWHKYTYDNKKSDQIIADTAFRDFVSSNGKLINYNDIDLTTFKYDSKGRISQSTEYVLGDTIVRLYNYNAQGNLQNPGSVYDNKLNIHLTNKIWMFIDRDYSINNPVDNGNYTYNSMGLPITINTNSQSVVAGFQFIVIGYPFGISKDIIYYSCP